MGPVPPREASVPNARVLIVDDDVSVTELFARTLRLEGFEVWAAHSAEEGLMLARTHRPHAVILDIRTPLASGIQILRALRAIPGMQQAPVTIVTGDYYLTDSQTQQIQILGAEVRFKPLWLEELVTLARDMLHTPVQD
jgi:two-component system OmpR family response regulator